MCRLLFLQHNLRFYPLLSSLDFKAFKIKYATKTLWCWNYFNRLRTKIGISLVSFQNSWTIKMRRGPRHHIMKHRRDLKAKMRGLPRWHSGWESACQCRGHRFEPWSGKIPRAAEQLGRCTTTTEPARLKPVLGNKRGRDSERPAQRDEEWPPLAATRESPRTETKTQHSQK